METLKAELAAQMARASLLDSKRTKAQTAYDHAVAARQQHMLRGDINDEKLSARLQAAVDTAASVLDSFAKPIAALAQSIGDIKVRIDAEQLADDRKRASEQLAERTDTLEKQLGPWLALTRELAGSAALVGNVHFEAGQIGRYLRNVASETDTAVHVTVKNLRSSVAAIRSGQHPIPRGEVQS